MTRTEALSCCAPDDNGNRLARATERRKLAHPRYVHAYASYTVFEWFAIRSKDGIEAVGVDSGAAKALDDWSAEEREAFERLEWKPVWWLN